VKQEPDLGEINLGNRFITRWKSKEQEEPSLTTKIKNIAKPVESVKDQINMVIQRIDIQNKTLEAAIQRFQNRDASIFQSVVKAIANRDQARANIYANELGEIRKVEKMLIQESLALESVSMRLRTVSEVGDLVTILGPAASVLNTVRSGMSDILPQASQELESIGSLLGDICTQTSQSSESTVNVGTVNEDALAILEEAEVAAEKRIRDQFPEVDTNTAVNSRTSVEI
jgi:division protein CdvB (Snf7/Vps24/ESCRT-III family)